jgi:neutral ceramidase
MYAARLLQIAGVLCLLFSAPQPAPGAAQPALLRAGAAVVDITPRRWPVSMLGSFKDRQATTAHDPLAVRAVVLDDGRTRLAIATCDICVVERDLFDAAKQQASRRTGIPVPRMLMAATHTHAAPNVSHLNAIPRDPEYVKQLTEGLAEGVVQAAARLQPARIGWGVAAVPEEVFNRRWFLRQEEVGPNPFGRMDRVKMNPCSGPDLLRPAGPTDPDVSVMSIQTAAGKPLALVANYSLHYVGDVPPGTVSADYFGEFARQIAERLGGDASFVGLMTNGTSGDVNNVNFPHPRPRVPPFERIRTVAARVADAAQEACLKMRYQDRVPLAMIEREIRLAIRKASPAELAEARAVLAEKDEKRLPPLAHYYAQTTLDMDQWPDTVSLKLQAIRIGGLGIVSMPNEAFAEIGLELKRRSPLRPTFVVDLANGYNGYLPTPEQHALGGYETWRATSSSLEVEASRKIIGALAEMLAEVAGK